MSLEHSPNNYEMIFVAKEIHKSVVIKTGGQGKIGAREQYFDAFQ